MYMPQNAKAWKLSRPVCSFPERYKGSEEGEMAGWQWEERAAYMALTLGQPVFPVLCIQSLF